MADEWLVEGFEEHRGRLRAVAYRMLGSGSEADDALQEAWLRLRRADAAGVENLGGWLTTVVARVCLNMLQSRRMRREEPIGDQVPEWDGGGDPEGEVLRADAVGMALLVVLDTLRPAERLAFVLHDMFGVPFEEIAPIVDRSPAAARQLASRARRRVRGASPEREGDLTRRRQIVGAFLAASREGDFDALLNLLDPDAEIRTDDAAAAMGAAGARGAVGVAATFCGRAHGARLAVVDGEVGAVWTRKGVPRMVFRFTVRAGRIAVIELVADPAYLTGVEFVD